MAAYADFTYYTGTYLGTAILSADFARLALRASASLDSMTLDRTAPVVTANTDAATIDKIKMATCAVAEEIQRQEQAGGDTAIGIQSESIGSNSVTYTAGSLSNLNADQRLSRAAKLYLGNTGLMFRGFADGEYGDAN
jgi:hypothetical protein